MRGIIIGAAAFLLAAPAGANAETLTYEFAKIADTSGAFSGFFGTPSINHSGDVTFRAGLDAGGQSINVGSGGPTTTIADTSGAFFKFGVPSINDSGDVAFFAALDTGGSSINVGSGGPTTTIADTNKVFSPSPFGRPSINNSGDVAFLANLNAGGRSINVGPGGSTSTIADTSGAFSLLAERSTDGSGPSINDLGDVAFSAFLKVGGRSINVGSGGSVMTIADTSGGVFSSFGDPSINDSGDVAFLASLAAGGESINVGSSGPTTTIADTSGAFSGFGAPSINESGDVAFHADLDGGGRSINVFSGRMLSSVLSTGDVLDGLVVAHVFLGREGLNDSGTLAFLVVFTDGMQAAYRASLVSENP